MSSGSSTAEVSAGTHSTDSNWPGRAGIPDLPPNNYIIFHGLCFKSPLYKKRTGVIFTM